MYIFWRNPPSKISKRGTVAKNPDLLKKILALLFTFPLLAYIKAETN